MANRFTDTEKWKDEWFLELEPLMKMLWIYMLDTCDYAGVWKVNFRLASYSIGTALDRQSALNALDSRIQVLSLDKWHIPKFISYQYRGKLNPKNNAHKGTLKLLEYHNIEIRPYLDIEDDYKTSETQRVDSVGSKDKEQEQTQDKDSSFLSSSLKEESVKKILPLVQNEEILKIDQVEQLFNDIVHGKGRLTASRGLSSKSIKDFITTVSYKQFQDILTWREVFIKTTQSDFLKGSKIDFVATLPWLLEHHNALNVLNGKYSGTSGKQKGGNSVGLAPTPDNPTGDPYQVELNQIRKNGEIA